jgi:hypothetical protein
VKPLFQIENTIASGQPLYFCLQIARDFFGFCICNQLANELFRLDYFERSDEDVSELTNMLSDYESGVNKFEKVLVRYDYPEVVMTPFSFYKKESMALLADAAYGKSADAIFLSDTIAEHKIQTAYGVPQYIHEAVLQKFPDAAYLHGATLDIKGLADTGQEGSIAVNFRTTDFSVIVCKNNLLLLAQTFPYSSPNDVLFYLIKICRHFGFLQQTAGLQLSGFIDKQSALYTELHHYFNSIEFADASWGMAGNYPAHFFTSLNKLARCG